MQACLGLVNLPNVTVKIRLKIHEKETGIAARDRMMWQRTETEVDSEMLK